MLIVSRNAHLAYPGKTECISVTIVVVCLDHKSISYKNKLLSCLLPPKLGPCKSQILLEEVGAAECLDKSVRFAVFNLTINLMATACGWSKPNSPAIIVHAFGDYDGSRRLPREEALIHAP
ncbi:unnamed protein product [Mesocestoides corti]|uniref:SCY domain-containing protein n=1 Tax=Mesocestoides corti TaxID=53468 RepID=A0A0R3U2D5_MESCO|nr:unnamed protein product [Mesocestoides corti]